MAKKPAKVEVPEVEAAAPVKTIGIKGLKGVSIDAKITLLTTVNPKRAGCAAFGRFALYQDGQTQAEFLAAGGTTPDLAYDTAHGFIAVEGYTSPKPFVPKEKAPKAVKEPKAKKAKSAAVVAEEDAATADLEAATAEESID